MINHYNSLLNTFSAKTPFARSCVYVLQILAISAAYFITGKLGTYLAIPPGYATAVWPPSGIALAGVLLFGYRVWPGILIGSILVNFSTSFAGATASEIAISTVITLAIGGGAALQAIAGAYALRRFANFPNPLATEKEVISFIVFGGFFSSLVNASIAVTTLIITGKVPLSNALGNWATWWAGDAIGILIFTPLILAWTLRPTEQWRKRRIAISLTLLIGFLLTTTLANYANNDEQKDLKLQFDKDTSTLNAALEEMILQHFSVLNAIKSFYSASNSVDKEEFQTFTKDALNNFHGIQALSWNPQVLQSERAAFERSMSNQTGERFKIYELNNTNQRVNAANRSEYVPVTFIEPIEPNKKALGYDVYSNKIRREAIQRAKDTGVATATAGITLVQDGDKKLGLLVFIPIYHNGFSTQTILDRRSNISGYAVAVIRFDDLISSAFKYINASNLSYTLIDKTAKAKDQLLFSTKDDNDIKLIDLPNQGLFGSYLTLKSQSLIDVGGRKWMFEVTPTQAYVAEHRGDMTWYVLLFGLLLTSMAGVIVLISSGRANLLRGLIDERTHELQASYDHLNKLSQQVPGVIYQFKLSADGRSSFPYASEGIREIYEVSPEQVQNDATPVFNILHPDDYDAIVASIQESALSLKIWQLEYRVNLPKQGVQWLQGQAHPERLEDGSTLWHGFITNISEQKKAEAIFHGIFHQSSFLAGVLDPHGCMINVNKTALSFTSAKREDVIGKYFPDTPWWSNPVDRSNLLETLNSAYSGKFSSFEATHPTPDGGHINVLFSATPIVLENGTYVSVTGVDITQRKFMEARLRMLSTAIEQSPTSVAIANLNAELEYVNPRFTQTTGFNREEVIGRNPRVLQSGLTDKSVYDDMWAKLTQGLPWVGEFVNRRKNGEIYYEEAYISPVKEDNNTISHYVAVKLDVTARKQAENELKIAATVFESQEGMLVTDADSIILRVNQAFTKITGYTADDAIGQTPRILSSGRQDKEFYIAMWASIKDRGAWEGEIWNRRKNGEVYPEHLTISSVKDSAGVVTNYVATLTDITMSKAASEEIKSLAFYDPLTQLPNRRLLLDRLSQALAASARSGQRGALLFMDLDHFKTLNDTLGHDVGDLLLQQVATRLTASVREGDTVSRLGGDEFVVLLEDLSEKGIEAAAQTEDIAGKILLALNQPYQLNTHSHHSTPSIGATLFNGHDQGSEELLKQADIAMYQSKTEGRNTLRFFDPKMQEAIANRADMEKELRKAIAQNQFELHYQIQVGSSGQALGAEALIRWRHPERGMISPFNFIPLAEESGLILPIGQWVLNTACAQLKTWQQNPLTQNLILSINVSAKQFAQSDFVEQVLATIQRHEINPDRLKLELTESMLVDNIKDIISKMNTLSNIGVRFSLDDFGTGYSSLQYLKKLPLNQLKIDQSFVRDLVTDSSDRAIVRTIITMAHSLDINVIAEGVETEEQRQMLLDNGCTYYQGYLFSKPVPVDEFEALLKI